MEQADKEKYWLMVLPQLWGAFDPMGVGKFFLQNLE
jgi:hypothetical protein